MCTPNKLHHVFDSLVDLCVCVCVCVCVRTHRRKIRAKEKREKRKPTQPVSQEMYDQLFKPQPQGSEEMVPPAGGKVALFVCV